MAYDNFEAAQALLGKGANPNSVIELYRGGPFMTPLDQLLSHRRYAASSGCSQSGSIHQGQYGKTCFEDDNPVPDNYDMSHYRFFNMLTSLLKAGANANKEESELIKNPLLFAAERGWTAAACALVAAGASAINIAKAIDCNKVPNKTCAAIKKIITQPWRSSSTTFAAINHPRVGAQSPFYELPGHVVQQICDLLKPAV